MRITESNVNLSAKHSLTVTDFSQESLEVWGGGQQFSQVQEKSGAGQAVIVELSQQGRELARTNAPQETVLFELSDC